MAFPKSVKDAALLRSGGRCECRRKHTYDTNPPHKGGRCPQRIRQGQWEAHHKTALASGGPDTLSNCEALCIRCHHLTGSYGG